MLEVLYVVYRYTEIVILNSCAGVKNKNCYLCSGYSPRIPVAGQKLLIPPCVWGDNCTHIVPLNQTYEVPEASRAVAAALNSSVVGCSMLQALTDMWCDYKREQMAQSTCAYNFLDQEGSARSLSLI